MTNYEKIKAMSVEEMADFLAKERFEQYNKILESMGQPPMTKALLTVSVIGRKRWLESEVEEDG